MSLKPKLKKLQKNYSTRNFKTLENGNNYNSEYSTTTYSNSDLNNSFFGESFYDFDLECEFDDFNGTIDSIYDKAKEEEAQLKEIDDFNQLTEKKVDEIYDWYNGKKKDFKDKYAKKKEKIMSNYKKNLHIDPIWGDFFHKGKIEALEKKLDSEYNNFIKTINKKRDKEVSKYKAQRELEYEELIKKHKKYS